MERIKEILCWVIFIPLGLPVLPYVVFMSLFRWRNPTFIFVGLYHAGVFLSFCAIGICLVAATSAATFLKGAVRALAGKNSALI